jgi:multiple sugar transport system permease protein
MNQSATANFLRDITAWFVVALFMFPILWWAIVSIQPASAIYDKDQINLFNFVPTINNYILTLTDLGSSLFNSREAILNSLIVAIGSTVLVLVIGVSAAFSLSHHLNAQKHNFIIAVILARIVPPIATIIPIYVTYRAIGLTDTWAGLILAHTAMNAPLAILLLKSFIDEVPREMFEAAKIDGATEFQLLSKILIPNISGGLATTAILCFIFSWTEFLMATYLTDQMHMLPIQLSILRMADWGPVAALSTATLLPSFVAILLVRKNLVRGLTWGMQR